MNLFSSQLYRGMEWITRFALLHILWAVTTVSGLVVFGLFPSTTALFSVIRDWLTGKRQDRLPQHYWSHFKAGFWQSTKLGMSILLLLLLMTLNVMYIRSGSGPSFTWTSVPLFAFLLIAGLFLLYLFPVFVHYDLKLSQTWKQTFLIMLISPMQSFFLILSIFSTVMIFRMLPALGFIFGSSLTAFLTMWAALHAFRKIEVKKQ